MVVTTGSSSSDRTAPRLERSVDVVHQWVEPLAVSVWVDEGEAPSVEVLPPEGDQLVEVLVVNTCGVHLLLAQWAGGHAHLQVIQVCGQRAGHIGGAQDHLEEIVHQLKLGDGVDVGEVRGNPQVM